MIGQLTSLKDIGRILGLVILVLTTPALGDSQDLRNLAMLLDLKQVDAFVEIVETIRDDGVLPEHYLDKNQARQKGWHPGSDLCDVAPGHAIGGNRFGNREGLLPDRQGRQWTEADLDFDCGRRNAKRLVFSNDGLIFVTIDHYESFYEVPQ